MTLPRRIALLAAPAMLAAPRLAAQPLAIRQDDQVAAGWTRGVLVRWGDRVAFDAPPWTPAQPSAEAAASQFGWDARIVALVPAGAQSDGVPRAMLVVAHPTVDAALAFPGGRDLPAVAGAMQGASLINLERRGAAWTVVDGGYQNRRLTAATLCRIGSEPVTGILGVTGGCATPWGSVLLAEGAAAAWRGRLPGFAASSSGLVVEVDPRDPVSVPVKHPALGRFGPADVAAGLSADGRAVVWMTDGRPGGFLYRFVSDGPAGPEALSAGRVAVARFDQGSLRWMPLPEGDPLAAARNAGGTGFDGPMGLAFDAPRGRLCLAVNGGAGRVIEIRMAAGDAAAETGIAETLIEGIAVAAEAPRGGATPEAPAWPWAPAALAFDGDGALLLATDRGGRPGVLPEALYRVPVEGAGRGRATFLLAAPAGAAVGGAAATGGALFAALAHPGATPGATWQAPATRWPDLRPDLPPRSTVVTLSR